jgi:hypothetical protein
VGFIHRDIHHALLFIAHPCPLHTSKHVHDGRERSLLATADKIGGREREEILHHHCTPPGTSTVAANEVNDIVICLLATADKSRFYTTSIGCLALQCVNETQLSTRCRSFARRSCSRALSPSVSRMPPKLALLLKATRMKLSGSSTNAMQNTW